MEIPESNTYKNLLKLEELGINTKKVREKALKLFEKGEMEYSKEKKCFIIKDDKEYYLRNISFELNGKKIRGFSCSCDFYKNSDYEGLVCPHILALKLMLKSYHDI